MVIPPIPPGRSQPGIITAAAVPVHNHLTGRLIVRKFTSIMLQKGDTVKGELSTLGYGGQALYKGKGITLFVPRGLPGDEVVVKIDKIKKNYGSGTLVKILKPSEHRVSSHCPAFDQGCGGCQWLHFDYKQQLFHKTKIVRETLKHIGKLNVKVEPVIGMQHPYAYRNKLSLHRDRKGKLGLCRENTQDVVVFDDCRQELPANVRVYKVLKKLHLPQSVTQVHIRSNTEGHTGIEFFSKSFSGFFHQLAERMAEEIRHLQGVVVRTYHGYQTAGGETFLLQQLGNSRFSIPHTSFFQTNYQQAETLLELVRRGVKTHGGQVVLDLYSGVGFFAIDLAPSVRRVIAVESDPRAVAAARCNARLNNIDNCTFIEEDVLTGLDKIREKRIDCLILDPPRLGCERSVLERIGRIRPAKIIYISCAPDTLARDLTSLVAYGYRILDCRPLDMFPHTYHIETVVQLVLE